MTIKELKNLRFKAIKDGQEWEQWTKIKISGENPHSAIPAINFFCLDEILWQPTKQDEIEAEGIFSMPLNEDDVAALVEDYVLLKEHYLKFQDIFISNKFTSIALHGLLHGKEAPGWVMRVSEILKENEYGI